MGYDLPQRERDMKTFFFTLALFASAAMSPAPENEQLVGSWRLVHFTRTILATGETVETFGKAPSGCIQFGRDGRMMMLIAKDERPSPPDPEKMTDQQRADLFRTMIGYGGTYAFDGKTLTMRLDVTWNQAWTGTEKLRHVTLDGRKLILDADPHVSYIDGKSITASMTFEKIQ